MPLVFNVNAAPSAVVPSKNVTVPSGIPVVAEFTVAVNVTDTPVPAGVNVEATTTEVAACVTFNLPLFAVTTYFATADPVTDGTIAYTPAGEVVTAAVLKPSVSTSPFTVAGKVPVNVGLMTPYTRVASFAVAVRGFARTTRVCGSEVLPRYVASPL